MIFAAITQLNIASASNSSYELEHFVAAKFYCPHALANGSDTGCRQQVDHQS